MKKNTKHIIQLLAGTALTCVICLAGAKTSEKAEAIRSHDVVVSISYVESETSATTDTSVSKFVIDDQRDINYFDPDLLTKNGCAYKNPKRLENNPVELIIPKTYNGTTIDKLGYTFEFHWGLDTPHTDRYYGPFYNCSRLERVFIPDTIEISNNIFEDLDYGKRNNLDIYIYSDDIQHFFEKSYRSIIFFADYSYYDLSYNALIDGEVLEELTVPENITEINEGAFLKCKSLKKVTVPNQVTQISEQAFYSPNLESIAIYDPNCEIADNAIANSRVYDNNAKKYVYSFDGVIYGYTDSTAQKYAEDKGFAFAALDKNNEVIVTSRTTAATTKVTTTSTSVSLKEGETRVVVVPIEVSTEPERTTDTQTTSATPVTTASPAVSSVDITKTEEPIVTTKPAVEGDTDGDGKLTVRDAANIAKMLSLRLETLLPGSADYNGDGKVNVRDAAAIANGLAKR